uniref:Uncharacterized protein n=1 Tax=Musca domestica TaxID=7370 RepID=A0A1I8M4Q9_MUSDO
MAMFRTSYQSLLFTLLRLLLLFGDFNNWAKVKFKVNGNPALNQRPFLQIESPSITRLVITRPHLPHYLSCKATIDESYYQNETNYFYTWFFNDNILKSLPRKLNDYYVYRNGTLRLPPAEKVSGVYRCKINANETAVISESITVEYPVLKRRPANINLTAFIGLTYTLNCPVYSVPPANVTWFYGNVSLSEISNDNSFLLLSNGSLVLRKARERNAGKYKCVAHNSFTSKSHRQFLMTLTVVHSEGRTLNNAQLIPHLQNTTLFVPTGGDLNISCCALTDDAIIEWWFQQTFSSPWIRLANNSKEYHIRSSIDEYEGYYTCSTAYSNQTFHVIVTTPPMVVEELGVKDGIIASPITYKCLVTGNPRPIITWYHNGAQFSSSFTRYINGNELLIPSFDPEENGIYQCFARNVAGEVYTAGEIRLKNKGEEKPNPLRNIRCFAHTFNSVNVTFETDASVSLFIVHIVQTNPFRWISPYSPMKLNASYVVINKHLPYIKPFELITRVLMSTSEISMGNDRTQHTIQSTLRSQPVTCCTQGLPPRIVHFGNNTFVTWSLTDFNNEKYFIIQFSTNFTQPAPEILLSPDLIGTTQHVNLTLQDISHKLTRIYPLNMMESRRVLKNAITSYGDNDVSMPDDLESDEDIYSLVVHANVTGLMLSNFTRLKLRILVITTDNENLAQDFRYVEWKTVVNDTGETIATPYHLTIVESRMLQFHFQESFNESCVQVCYLQIHYPRIIKDERKCEHRTIINSELEVTKLRPNTHYSFHFSSCDTNLFYGQLDVVTLPDPPGTISNQRVTRHNGLKLNWDPPLQPNGKIHHYNILWTLGNVTHETNVMECAVCFYKFPNISEEAKINISVRVVGETGVGAPVSIDLRNINHRTLEIESSGSTTEVYSGIAIGSLLSIFCIFGFALLIMFQRKRFKARQHGPTHLSTPTDIHFGNLSNINLPSGSAGGLSSNTMPPDSHEMQTLIPKAMARHLDILAGDRAMYETTQLANGGGVGGVGAYVVRPSLESMESSNNASILSGFYIGAEHNLSSIPLCQISPQKKSKGNGNGGGGGGHASGHTDGHTNSSKPFFIPFKNTAPSIVGLTSSQKQSSSAFAANSGVPPNSISLAAVPVESISTVFGGTLRSSNLSRSNSNGSSATNSIKSKQFHANFPKHSTSIDGICLLDEEEAAATITPTTDSDVTGEVLRNGFHINGEDHRLSDLTPGQNTSTLKRSSSPPPKHSTHNSNNSKHKKSTNLLKKKTTPQPSLELTATTLTTATTKSTNARPKSTAFIVPASGGGSLAAMQAGNAASSSPSLLKAQKPRNSTNLKAKSKSSTMETNFRHLDMDPNG